MDIPEGLFLQRDVITSEKEVEIISWLDAHEWSNELTRRTQQYGYGYNYRNKKLVPGPAMEGPILEVAQIFQRSGLMNPVQCIVNEYTRAQGITAHIDRLDFGAVVLGLSIGADGVMVFERNRSGQHSRFDCFLPRRSVVMLSGAARYEWTHSIEKKVRYIDDTGITITKPQNYHRISLTYRELARKD